MSATRTWFIADLHLDPAHQAEYQLALDFLGQLTDVDELYVLGDLFEYWIGDDAGLPLYHDVITALARLSNIGCTVTVMHGNRDFLLGSAFVEASGTRLIRSDELLVEFDGEPLLLMHGDTLCTDDHDYLTFRQQVRNEQWQQAFLAKPVDDRLAYARQLRQQSQHISAGKTRELMDVNDAEVQARLQANQCQRMIHGHTHRPDVHTPGTGLSRMVVGDWHATHADYVLKDSAGFHLQRYTGGVL